jgi:zinc transport system substrate-binding protein
MIFMRRLPLVALAAAAAVALGAGACGSGGAVAGPPRGKVAVTASFYPLQYVAQRVGGDAVQVRNLTKPGAEPHDLELTPRDVAALSKADVVVFLRGFQPAVDDAVATAGPRTVFDAAASARLDLTYTPIEDGNAHKDEAGAADPHFWLDPTRLAAVATALTERLATAAPAHAADFRANDAALQADLRELDTALAAGLRHCASTDLVTSHNAFGYLAERYGLHQVGLTGLTPESEPAGRHLAAVSDFVRRSKVRTIYYETLVSPRVAQTVAGTTGVRTAVLDPLEGLDDRSAGADYLQVMRSNLATLKAGQPCR